MMTKFEKLNNIYHTCYENIGNSQYIKKILVKIKAMNPFQLHLLLIMSTIQKMPKKKQKVPKQFQKKMIRQFQRKPRNNRQRSNRHIFTNKDMRM
tara:strand:- start:250 stop:534 length:285 start_codon:yes stop_codon:yes gene_type:complete